MNFESMNFRKMTTEDIYEYVKNKLPKDKKAYLLSSEYATYLSGRCVEIKMLPLSFREFINFYGYEIKESKSPAGGMRKRIFKDGESFEPSELFEASMRFGGMPGIADVGLDIDKALTLLDGIY